MSQTCCKTEVQKKYSSAHLGAFEQLSQYQFSHDALPFKVEGKVFLNRLMNLTSAEVSLNRLPPNSGMPFCHRHQKNEEIYVFVRGKGEFQVDGESFPVEEGSVVVVSPEGSRCWRSGPDEPLHFIVIQAPAGRYDAGADISDGVGVAGPVVWPK